MTLRSDNRGHVAGWVTRWRAVLGDRQAWSRRAAPWGVAGWVRWVDVWRGLARRFQEDRLGLTAASLTFTTLIALVPLLTVGLAVFTAFPKFAALQGALEAFLVRHLVPESIARPVLEALTGFASRASRMGALGLATLVLTALALMLTIDRTLNALWRVRHPRPLAQRVLLYWALLTLGPLLLGASLTLASWALSASQGWVGPLPAALAWAFEASPFVLLGVLAAGLFRLVPHAPVRWSDAAAGGLFVALGTELARRALGWYVAAVPAMDAVYGAFATLPILLLWIHLMWLVVLMGAVIAAYAPQWRQSAAVVRAEAGGALDAAWAESVVAQSALKRRRRRWPAAARPDPRPSGRARRPASPRGG
jgi:membrane protein